MIYATSLDSIKHGINKKNRKRHRAMVNSIESQSLYVARNIAYLFQDRNKIRAIQAQNTENFRNSEDHTYITPYGSKNWGTDSRIEILMETLDYLEEKLEETLDYENRRNYKPAQEKYFGDVPG